MGEEWTLRGTWGVYNRFPTFYELFGDGIWVRPNPGFDARSPAPVRERSHQYDFGPSWRGDLGGNLSVTYFKRKTEDAIGFMRTDIPNLTASSRFNLHFLDGDLTNFADFKYIGRVYAARSSEDDYEEHLATVELWMRARLPLGFEVTAGVDDITNAGPNQRLMRQRYYYRSGNYYVYDHNVPYPGEGRAFYGTVAWKF